MKHAGAVPRRRLLLLSLLCLPVATRRNAIAGDAVSVVDLRIASDGDFLAFVPEELTVTAGARVRVWFSHAGKRVMQDHNWVLVKPGTADAVERAALQAGEAKRWTAPNDANVLAATTMCGPGKVEVVEFVAPAPGDYPFICSFPGHGAEMHGVLHVVAG